MLALATQLEQSHPPPCFLPRKIHLQGFLELTLLEQRVLDALRQQGVDLQLVSMPERDSHADICSFPSLDDEFAAAANWARQQMDRGVAHIGIVINGLESLCTQVRQILENILCTEQRMALEDMADCVFHLGQGESLAEHPVVSDALMLLQIFTQGQQRRFEFPIFSRFLLSPYWAGSHKERVARGQLEQKMRKSGEFQWSLDDILHFIRRNQLETVLPVLFERSCGAVELVTGDSEFRQVVEKEEYAAQFLTWLNQWGWPGPLASGSDTGACVQQFSYQLERLAGLSAHSAGDALQMLRQMCVDTRIELRGGPLSPIQVLSPEDAAGLEFDAIWIANVHEGNWPSAARLNPLIPGHLADRIPRCTAPGELAYFQKLTAVLKRVAPEIRFSWSRQSGDLPQNISPLLTGLPAKDMTQSVNSALHSFLNPGSVELDGYRNHPWLEAVGDAQGLALSPSRGALPASEIPGGVGIVRDQSVCPLMAYLRHRLKARFKEMPTAFADAALRGNLMHGALQALYAGQVGREGLPSADKIEAAVTEALQLNKVGQRLLPITVEAERLRLIKLLEEWLLFEKDRKGFIVESLEQTVSGEFLGHAISVRADRIDQLADGSLLIMDYKSSSGSTTAWAKDRLGEAQLPLYAVLLARTGQRLVSGITLAAVRSGECSFSGVTGDVINTYDGMGAFDKKNRSYARRFENWEQLFAHWERSLDSLATEIIDGKSDNTVHDQNGLKWSGMDVLLRREEGEAWLLAHEHSSPCNSPGAAS